MLLNVPQTRSGGGPGQKFWVSVRAWKWLILSEEGALPGVSNIVENWSQEFSKYNVSFEYKNYIIYVNPTSYYKPALVLFSDIPRW